MLRRRIIIVVVMIVILLLSILWSGCGDSGGNMDNMDMSTMTSGGGM